MKLLYSLITAAALACFALAYSEHSAKQERQRAAAAAQWQAHTAEMQRLNAAADAAAAQSHAALQVINSAASKLSALQTQSQPLNQAQANEELKRLIQQRAE
jgi:hypothetical protein